MVLSDEVKQILEAYRVPVRRKYFQAVGRYLTYDPETGEWQ